jgi:hypothetical protein
MTEILLADRREWITQGMGRCGIYIEQYDLPENIGGMLITSHDSVLDFFKLHILINSRLCGSVDHQCRVEQKIAAVHEFTHTVAALSGISRVKTALLIERMKERLRQKTHAIYLDDIRRLAAELNNALFDKMSDRGEKNTKNHFPDEHFRLGIEDFPVSYPRIFEEFLLSREMFDEYFSKDLVQAICRAISERDGKTFVELTNPNVIKIAKEKALDFAFVLSRIMDILALEVANYKIRR